MVKVRRSVLPMGFTEVWSTRSEDVSNHFYTV